MRPDVVVIGAGVIGAACAYYAARAGLRVAVLDRGPIAGGTSGAGEGNLLASDKRPGPELDLIVRSLALWRELGADLGRGAIELEPKGALMVAATPGGLDRLLDLAARQRRHGVASVSVTGDELRTYEPRIAGGLAGGCYYPDDMQVQPMLAAAHLLRASGAAVHCGVAVRGLERDQAGRVAAVLCGDGGRIGTAAVVNAAGVWAPEVAALAGTELPITPRRGFVLVTEPVGAASSAARGVTPPIRHKVYSADYLSNVFSDDADLQTSPVVEGTRSGTVLIGASRERVGFDPAYPLGVLRRLAAQAVALFPFLAELSVLRAYRGFRPYTPDHVPVIGPDPRVPGLYHACGHEGAGIGLAPVTGAMIAAGLTGAVAPVDPGPFLPERFT